MISVIVPVYNVEKYLRECLDSLIAQTYQHIEVIMVDDGSTDSSGAICDEYAAKYENFTVIHKNNQGLGMARNTGLKHISGDYVAFLDSDDYMEPDCLEKMHSAMLSNQADYCKCGFKRVNNEKKILFLRQYEEEHFADQDVPGQLLPRLIGSAPDRKDSMEPCVWGALFSAHIIKEHHLRFPSERELISEDVVFHIEYMQYAKGAYIMSYTGINYRVNEISLTQSYRPDRFESCCIFYRKMKARLLELGYDESTLFRLSRIFFVYLRVCISQETEVVSGLKKKENLRNIRKICDHSLVREIIDEYPVKKLGMKQKLFLYLIKFRMEYILYYMTRIKLL